MSKRVLVTNDDGIDAEGIHVLVGALLESGYEPIVVAPDGDYSGAGTSILGFASEKPALTYERRVLPGAPDVEAYALAAPPAACVILAMREAFGRRPDLVASGINYGLNTGPAVRHSGTVAAAMTATTWQVPALAISAEYNFEGNKPMRYDTAAELGVQVLGLIADSDHQVLNLNVPCSSIDELAGVRSAPLAVVSRYRSFIESHTDGLIKMGYEISDEEVSAESDTGLVQAGFAAITSLVGVSSLDCRDLICQLAEAAS